MTATLPWEQARLLEAGSRAVGSKPGWALELTLRTGRRSLARFGIVYLR